MKQHKNLTLNHWKKYTFAEQMANVGAEVGRALKWRGKKKEYSLAAFERSLELIDLTLASLNSYPRLKEVARTREVWVDYFWGENEYQSTKRQWERYFLAFNVMARNSR